MTRVQHAGFALGILYVLAVCMGCTRDRNSHEFYSFSVGDEVQLRASDDKQKMIITRISGDEIRCEWGREHAWFDVHRLQDVEEEIDEIDLTRPDVVVAYDGEFRTLDWQPTLDGSGRLVRIIINDKDFVHRTPDFTVEKPKLAEVPEKPLSVGDMVQHKLSDRTPLMMVVRILPSQDDDPIDRDMATCRWVDSLGQIRTEHLFIEELVRYVEPAPQETQFAHLVMPETLE